MKALWLVLMAALVPWGIPRTTHDAPRTASLTIGRLHYDGGGDWYANPSSLPNLLTALRERTTLPVADRERVVTLTGPELWDVPYIYMTGHGNVHFSDVELRTLRRYLEQGGFLHADDNYGMDKSFRREIARVFPDHPLVEVPLTHPIYNLVYAFPKGIPKIHEHDGLPAQGFGIFWGDRLVVYYSYQSDLVAWGLLTHGRGRSPWCSAASARRWPRPRSGSRCRRRCRESPSRGRSSWRVRARRRGSCCARAVKPTRLRWAE